MKSLSCIWLFATRLLHPWDFPGKNTGVGCISFARKSSQPRDWTQVSCIIGRCFTIWATREVHSQVGINPWQRFCHKLMRLLGNHRAGLLTCFAQGVSFTQTHYRDSKVQQKTCLLGEQRTRAPSILTLSWRIPDKPPRWKVAVEPQKIPGFLASGGEEFNPWPVMSLDHSELLCNKVLLKYKRDRGNSVY